MGEFFGSMYCLFENFFGLELADYLWGVASPESPINSFIGIGWTMLVISILFLTIFYYILDHPRLNHWWGWGIFFVINALINFLVGWQWVLKAYYAGKMVAIDPSTNLTVPLNIYNSELINFGVSNMILAAVVFIIFTLIIKWGSTNCSRAPFVK